MQGQTGMYIYGSEARDFDVVVPLRPNERRTQSPEHRQQVRPRRKARTDKFAVVLVTLSFIAFMSVGIFYLHLQFQSTYLQKNVVNLKREVVDMEKENTTLKMKMDYTYNLNDIYKKATKTLGMKAANENQIVEYNSRKSTQIRQHSDIPSAD